MKSTYLSASFDSMDGISAPGVHTSWQPLAFKQKQKELVHSKNKFVRFFYVTSQSTHQLFCHMESTKGQKHQSFVILRLGNVIAIIG